VTRRQQLTEPQIAALYDPPTGQRELVRHYTLSDSDIAIIRRCRGDQNLLGGLRDHVSERCHLSRVPLSAAPRATKDRRHICRYSGPDGEGFRTQSPSRCALTSRWLAWPDARSVGGRSVLAGGLHDGKKSFLSFPMIGRLAELFLRVNPMARDALRLTYSHLFMDEFQDMTQVQYDLVETIFRGTETVVTAVGDNKQQIMRWAMEDPFGAFHIDFAATPTPLHNNYRSSPDLVRIQHVLAQALDARAVEPVSKSKGTVAGDSCAIWDFSTPEIEADRLADFIVKEMKARGLSPRDFVLLVRQKAGDYAAILEPAFQRAGIPLRNEAGVVGTVMLQELLAEEVSDLLVCVLRLAMTKRAGRHWTECQEALGNLRGIGPEDGAAQARFARELDAFATTLGTDYSEPPQTGVVARAVVGEVLDFIGRERLVAVHPAYAQGDWFSKVVDAAAIHLKTSSEGADDWTVALDGYEGLHAVPLRDS
jgi:hypothetical protein